MAIKPIPSAQYQTGWRRDTHVCEVIINEEEGSGGGGLCTPSLAAPWRVVEVKEEAGPFNGTARYPDSESA